MSTYVILSLQCVEKATPNVLMGESTGSSRRSPFYFVKSYVAKVKRKGNSKDT